MSKSRCDLSFDLGKEKQQKAYEFLSKLGRYKSKFVSELIYEFLDYNHILNSCDLSNDDAKEYANIVLKKNIVNPNQNAITLAEHILNILATASQNYQPPKDELLSNNNIAPINSFNLRSSDKSFNDTNKSSNNKSKVFKETIKNETEIITESEENDDFDIEESKISDILSSLNQFMI